MDAGHSGTLGNNKVNSFPNKDSEEVPHALELIYDINFRYAKRRIKAVVCNMTKLYYNKNGGETI